MDKCLKTYYIDDDKTIQYSCIEDVLEVVNGIYRIFIDSKVNTTDYGVRFNNNGAYIDFNVKTNTICFSSFFQATNITPYYMNFLRDGSFSDDSKYLKFTNYLSYGGDSESYCLDDYNLKMYLSSDKTKTYIPSMILTKILTCQIVSDFYISENGMFLTKDKFLDKDGNLNEYGTNFYSNSVTKYSEELAYYQYNLLCLDFDMFYGLAKTHSMTNGFDDFCIKTNMKEKLLSTNPLVYEDALAEVVLQYFDDVHIKYEMSGEKTGYYKPDVKLGAARQAILDKDEEVKAARTNITNFMPYMEYGDTAYVTFDTFTAKSKDYYANDIELTNDMSDTYNIIAYANKQIKRDASPIKNVVLDLSANGGGAIDAAAFVISWMLGEYTEYTKDSKGSEKGFTTMMADVNFDGKYDELDNISNLNLFCITSSGSFSCGNYVPTYLKYSDKVTMLGERSGGGTCSVLYRNSATGSLYRLSSRNMLCTYRNGEYRDVEMGAEPDYYINSKHFSNREFINSFIKSIIPNN